MPPLRLWLRPAILLVLVGFLLSILAGRVVHQRGVERQEAAFALESQEIVAAISAGIERQLATVEDAAGFVEIAWPITPSEFDQLFDAEQSTLSTIDSVALVELFDNEDEDAFLAREQAIGGVSEVAELLPLPIETPLRAVISRSVGYDRMFGTLLSDSVGLDVSAFSLMPMAQGVLAGETAVLPIDLFLTPELETDFEELGGSTSFTFVVPVESPEGDIGAFLVATGALGPLIQGAIGVETDLGVRITSGSNDDAVELLSLSGQGVGPVEDAARRSTGELVAVGLDFGVEVWSSAELSPWRTEVVAVTAPGLIATAFAALALGIRLRARENEREAREQLDRSEKRAVTDPLTQMLNRTGINDALEAELAADRTNSVLGVMFCDLDRFKRINDTLGHDAGDELLVQIAGRLRALVRSEDHVGRFGGDEFILIGRFADVDGARGFASRVSNALSLATVLDSFPVDIAASVGLTIVDADDRREAHELLRDADTAMYRAKAARAGGVVEFDAGMRAEVVEQVRLEGELRHALLENELIVYYQPLFAVDGGLVGAEALTRWEHPGRGLLATGAFMRAAQESGLWRQISWRTLDLAVARMAQSEASDTLELAVNVAPEQLLHDDVPELITGVLARHGFPAHRLVVEISEDVVMDDDGRMVRILRRLHDGGVKLALDDFGAGRSSFELLRRLSFVDTVKLDRAFVQDVADDETSQAVVQGVVATAQALGCVTVAEGVETTEQLEACRCLGIDHIQGFLLGRPMPFDELPLLERS